MEAAHAAGHSRQTYLGALYHRLAGRIGKKRAAVAVARKLLVILYHMLSTHEPYRELGADYHEQRTKQALARRAVRQLQSLGYDISLQPRDPAA